MNNLLFLVSVLSAFIWALGYFWYQEGRFIHVFLAAAVVAALLRIFRNRLIVVR